MRRLILLLAASVVGCASVMPSASDGYENCPNSGLLSFVVDVRDSATALPISGTATMSWTAGLSTGSATNPVVPPTGTLRAYVLGGPYGRPGNYQISVASAGYRTWQRNNVLVQSGVLPCSVGSTVQITALLQH
jgi:hypothetical protein